MNTEAFGFGGWKRPQILQAEIKWASLVVVLTTRILREVWVVEEDQFTGFERTKTQNWTRSHSCNIVAKAFSAYVLRT